MFAVFNSPKEKSIMKVLLNKTKPNCWEQISLVYPLVYIYDSMGEFRQLSTRKIVIKIQLIKISSEEDQPLLSAGLLFSDQSYCNSDESLIRTLQSQHLSVKKNKKTKKKLWRSKWSLIRHNCFRKHF